MNISFVVAKNYESGDEVCKQPIVAIFATNGCQSPSHLNHSPTCKRSGKASSCTLFCTSKQERFLLFSGNKSMVFASYYRKN